MVEPFIILHFDVFTSSPLCTESLLLVLILLGYAHQYPQCRCLVTSSRFFTYVQFKYYTTNPSVLSCYWLYSRPIFITSSINLEGDALCDYNCLTLGIRNGTLINFFKYSGNTNLASPIEKETISVYRDSIVNTNDQLYKYIL